MEKQIKRIIKTYPLNEAVNILQNNLTQEVIKNVPSNIIAKVDLFCNDNRQSIEGNIYFKKIAGMDKIEFFKEITFDSSEQYKFEVNEKQAGKTGEEMHIFGEYKSLTAAIKQTLRNDTKPLKII